MRERERGRAREREREERDRLTRTCPLSHRQVTIVCPGPRSLATFNKAIRELDYIRCHI